MTKKLTYTLCLLTSQFSLTATSATAFVVSELNIFINTVSPPNLVYIAFCIYTRVILTFV